MAFNPQKPWSPYLLLKESTPGLKKGKRVRI